MQISAFETTSGLERRLCIDVAASEVENKINQKLSELSRSVKLDGFRPGKIPMRVIKQKFSGNVRSEIVGQVIQTSLNQALGEKAIRPACQPSIQINKNEEGEDLAFTAVFEVYPEVQDIDIDCLKVEKSVVEIVDADIDKIIDRWRRGRATWTVTDEAAKDGDRLKIDYQCHIDGELAEDASGKDANIIIGASVMVPGFEEGLIGNAVNSEVLMDIDMPKNHKNEKLAGKKAKVKVSIKQVEYPTLPEVDEQFCKDHGVAEGGVDKLREQVKQSLILEADKRISDGIKQQIFQQLLDKHEVDLPKSMIAQEKQVLIQQYKQQLGGKEIAITEEQDTQFDAQALRSVKLGILIGAYVNKQGIKPDQTRVQAQIREISRMYQEPEQAIEKISKNQAMMSRIIATTLEDQAVEKIKTEIEMTEVASSFDELTSYRQ